MQEKDQQVIHTALACFALSAAGTALCGCNDASAHGSGSPESRKPVLVFGRTGLGPGDLHYPRAMAVAKDGCVFVVDKTARIQRFNPQGQYEAGWQMPESSRLT